MAEAVVRYGKDTWVRDGTAAQKAAPHNDASRLRVQSATAFSFLSTRIPVPPGMVVVEAYYDVFVAKPADWAGTKTLKLRRADKRVGFGKMTWDNKPGVTGSSQPTVTVTNPVDGQRLRFNITTHATNIAGGSPNYGWRLETDSATAHRIYGYDSDYPPVLTVVYAISPSQPVDLSPAGGPVSLQFPMFTFDAVDLKNPQDMTDLQIQIGTSATTNADGSLTTPEFDTAWVPSSVPQWDSAGSAWAGIADGATRYWVARYRNGAAIGDWSDPVPFSRAVKNALTITNPVAGSPAYVTEATPAFMHTFAGTQVAWRKWITPVDDLTEIINNSRKSDGTDTSWTPAKARMQDGVMYRLHVAVWDDKHRLSTPGDPDYTYAYRDFVVNDVPGVPAPALVSVEQDGGTPFVVLTWTRAAGAPDSWTIKRDGDTIATRVLPEDTLQPDGTHRWVDHTATPQDAHTYWVRAVENGESSPVSNGIAVTTYPEGVWLLDHDHGLFVTLGGIGVQGWRRTDRVTVFTTVTGKKVAVFFGDEGIASEFEGTLEPVEGRTSEQWRADFEKMAKNAKSRTYQLVAAWLSIPVRCPNMSVTPHPDTNEDYPMDLARFDFFQVPA